jgi:threonine/homoserine/homoserine lactone efflux protein
VSVLLATAGRAVVLGLTLAAPIGPMAVLLMRRSLVDGLAAGLLCGAGIATADALYAALAAAGIAGISAFLAAHASAVHLIAGAIMIAIGARMLLAPGAEPRSSNASGRYVETVFLTLTNPMTILTYAAAFNLLAPIGSFDLRLAAVSVAGVFAGSMLWWVVLGFTVSRMRHVITGSLRLAIDRVAGVFLIAFGARTAIVR